jgi:protein gp37
LGDKSAIEWTDATWNPITGCNRVTAGCDHCYAEILSLRLQKMGVAKYRNGFDVTLHPDALSQQASSRLGVHIPVIFLTVFRARPRSRFAVFVG